MSMYTTTRRHTPQFIRSPTHVHTWLLEMINPNLRVDMYSQGEVKTAPEEE